MAISDGDIEAIERGETAIRLKRFTITGLFGYLNHTINFPQMSPTASAPEILIVEGQNGTGKTTIMKMLAGITSALNFDIFRQVPFHNAELELSNGDILGISSDISNPEFPIVATFRHHVVRLARVRESGVYTSEQEAAITAYREDALPLLKSVDFELLTIDRSIVVETKSSDDLIYDSKTGQFTHKKKDKTLAARVRDFLRDAQVNYRRFFQAEELELLPRILKQFSNIQESYDADTLLGRINRVLYSSIEISRFGLQTDEKELETLANLLRNDSYKSDQHILALLASYIEIHESRHEARQLIALRLSLFETIMDEFFVGKKIRISYRHGFEIIGTSGEGLKEKDLSSGEFHFLYMMVAALLCERTGTIIAIDEPELSLHVSWQRRLIGALSKCASGASPLFFLSTHSTAISSSQRFAVQTLSSID
ncbi:AAA family ATPase [Allosphingosinicella vermicomposti]|uniref:AAA family ATPase n=1 Tax=Allosphingosinicella vermicomposti TaxID=614671 RepID=UPI000D0FBA3B|nr:AAA family ATPase [Allosphingosinicella vermicomposti]